MYRTAQSLTVPSDECDLEKPPAFRDNVIFGLYVLIRHRQILLFPCTSSPFHHSNQ